MLTRSYLLIVTLIICTANFNNFLRASQATSPQNIATPKEFVAFALNASPHEILGVAKNAGESEISKAFRKLSLKFHPDRWHGQEAIATDAYQRLVNARDDAVASLGKESQEQPSQQAPTQQQAPVDESKIKTIIEENMRREALLGTLTEDKLKNDLAAGADINAKNDYGSTALMAAARRGNVAVMQLLIKYKANVNAQNDRGENALMEAIGSHRDAAVKLLVQNRADTNVLSQNAFNTTPLMLATSLNSPTIVSLLIQYGADANIKNKHGRTALEMATEDGNTQIIELLRPVTFINIKSTKQQPSMPDLEAKFVSEALNGTLNKYNLKDYLDKGVNIDASSSLGYTALMSTVLRNNPSIPDIELLLKNKADINIQTSRGTTALMMAVEQGKKYIVEFLLEHGANPDLKNKDGNTALNIATKSGDSQMIKLLHAKQVATPQNTPVQEEKKAAAPNLSSQTPSAQEEKPMSASDLEMKKKFEANLIMQATTGFLNEDLLKLYLSKGVDINAQDSFGNTALMQAAKRGRANVVELLLKYKADSNVKNNMGETALEIATKAGKADIAELLRT